MDFGMIHLKSLKGAVAGIAVVIAVGAAAGVASLSAAAAEEGAPLVEFRGVGDRVTGSFTVDEAWSVEWSTEDERIEIFLKATESGIPSVVASPVDPGEGRAVYAQGGTFHFEIEADGPWRLSVFDE